jgi:predicted ester cyclase
MTGPFEHELRSFWIRPLCDMTLCNSSPDSTGTSGGSDFVEMIIAAMPDFRLDIEDIFATGDRAAVRLRMTGTHTGEPLLGCPATGKELSANAVFIYRFNGGRIAEAWQMVDGLAFFRLAGLLS